ncbi:MAG: ABC transporter permease [Acidobacteriota bacterium]
MKQIWTVLKREYLFRVKSKAFIIGTLLGPLALAAMVGVPMLLTKVEVKEERRVAVLDDGGSVASALPESAFFGKNSTYRVTRVTSDSTGRAKTLERLKGDVIAQRLHGVLIVPEKGEEFLYLAKNVGNFVEIAALENAVSSIVVEARLKAEGLDPGRIEELTRAVNLRALRVTQEGVREEKGQTIMLTYVMSLILYTSLLIYGVSIMRSVIEEKSTRIVEVLLSSVSPFRLMAGKILGVGSVGLTQYLIWAAFGALISAYGALVAGAFLPRQDLSSFVNIPISVLLYFLLFFVLGYFVYATLYAGIGAMVNSEDESQQVQLMVTMFLVLPIMLTPLVLKSPDSRLSVALSLFPFFSPVLMMMRVCIINVPAIQIALCVGFSLAATLLVTWVVARIYRIGILMYGKRPTLIEVVRWIRYS